MFTESTRMLRRLLLLSISLLGVIFISSPSLAQFDEDDFYANAFGEKKKDDEAIARVYLSTVYIGDLKYRKTDNGFILYGIKPLLEEIENTYTADYLEEFNFYSKNKLDSIDLNRFQDILKYQYNENDLRLDLLIDIKYRKLQTWNTGNTEAQLSQPSNFSWFLNGFLNQEIGENARRSGDFDSAMSIKSFVFEGRWNTDFEDRVDSLYYRMVKDVEDIPMRLTLGDTRYKILGQQRAFLSTGLTIESNFNLQPYNRFFPSGGRDFLLENDAWIVVKINERFYSRIYLRAGRHSLQDLPIQVGQNEIEIIIEERNGRTRKISFTETGSVNVYKKGTHFFSYSLGSKEFSLSDRYRDSTDDFDSIFSFYHLYGLSDYVTTGGYGQIAQDEKLFALVSNWRSGFINGDFTIARGQEETVTKGNYYELGFNQTYWSNRKRRSFAIRGSYSDTGYQRIGEDALGEELIATDFTANWQHNESIFSSFGGRWQSYNRSSQQEDYIAFYQLTKNTQDWNLQMRLEQSRQEDFSFELTLNYFWGENKNLVSQYQFQSDNERHSVRNTYSSPHINRGVQVDALAVRDEFGDSQQFNADYTHERFLASVDYNRSKPDGANAKELGNVKIASAVSFVDGDWGWSRPITQAFAILTKSDKKDNVIVNPTGKDKRFESIITNNLNGVLTQLNPYTSQEIYVEAQSGQTLRFEENKKSIVASYKSGYVFNFEAKGDRLVKGQLLHQGKIIKLNVFTFKGVDSDTEDTSFTDEEGRFWVDGIKPGKYYIQWYDWKSEPFEIKGEEFFNDVGEIQLTLEEE